VLSSILGWCLLVPSSTAVMSLTRALKHSVHCWDGACWDPPAFMALPGWCSLVPSSMQPSCLVSSWKLQGSLTRTCYRLLRCRRGADFMSELKAQLAASSAERSQRVRAPRGGGVTLLLLACTPILVLLSCILVHEYSMMD
jgi:hypothetical protein